MTTSAPPAQPFNLTRIGAGLTFAEALAPLERALAENVAVVQAPPGTGKTTLVPPLVANLLAHREAAGVVLVTGPRRVVVRAAAQRLAHLTGTEVGDLVGYRVRGESRTSKHTRVQFVTPGIALRQLLNDPELTGVDAVVLDEVHERGLESDLLLGMLAEVRELRDDLMLVAMSATLDAARFATLLGSPDSPAPLVDSPSALHELTVISRPFTGPRTDERGVNDAFLEHIAQTTARAHADLLRHTPDADALVFLPGAREVESVVARLETLAPQALCLPLHGQLEAAAQDAAVGGRLDECPRIIVSTSLAESSLTVPGVRLVVDSGLAREPRRDIARDMSGLVTVSASRASAEQRAGRAARQAPGTVVRCYDEQTYLRMPEHVTPEIATADLTSAALMLAAWGTPGGLGLRLPTTPPPAAIAAAHRTLISLDALDAQERITDLGRSLAALPTTPQLGRALLTGTSLVGSRRAAEVVAALSENARTTGADLATLLRDLRSGNSPRFTREVKRLQRIAEDHALQSRTSPAQTEIVGASADSFIVALAYPQRVARRVTEQTYQLAAGSRAALPTDSPLTGEPWLAIAEASRTSGAAAAGTGAVIRLAGAITQELAEEAAAHLLVDEVRASWNATSSKVAARRVQALGAIEFSSTPTKPTPDAAHRAVEEALRTSGLGLLTFSAAANELRQRMAFLHHHFADPWPNMADHALLERLDEWLAPEMDALANGTKASNVSLVEPLRRLLPWPEATRFDDLAPERLHVPSGSRIRLQYPPIDSPGEPAVVAVKLQECFGLDQTPTLADGRSRVLFHLLSPAGRPLAITDDLASFWSGPYAGVRAEMRGRYPKHPWPEDPWNHVPTAKTKRHLG